MITRVAGFLLAASCLAAGSGRAQQPAPVTQGGSPVVSPDGRWIVFGSDRDGQGDLYLIAADGSGERRLTNSPSREGSPRWSRDGREVFFDAGTRDSVILKGVDIATGAERTVARLAGFGGSLSPGGQDVVRTVGSFTGGRLVASLLDGTGQRFLTDTSGAAFNPAWSPDGRQVAYSRLAPDRSISVWVVAADGSGARPVTHLAPTEGRAQVPSWSPDGRRLAVQVGRPGGRAGNAHVAIVDLATGTLTPLAPHEGAWLDETPTWFPDGRIAFQSDRTGRMEVWVMNADGTGARQVTGRQ